MCAYGIPACICVLFEWILTRQYFMCSARMHICVQVLVSVWAKVAVEVKTLPPCRQGALCAYFDYMFTCALLYVHETCMSAIAWPQAHAYSCECRFRCVGIAIACLIACTRALLRASYKILVLHPYTHAMM
jgi:hypothetical protein